MPDLDLSKAPVLTAAEALAGGDCAVRVWQQIGRRPPREIEVALSELISSGGGTPQDPVLDAWAAAVETSIGSPVTASRKEGILKVLNGLEELGLTSNIVRFNPFMGTDGTSFAYEIPVVGEGLDILTGTSTGLRQDGTVTTPSIPPGDGFPVKSVFVKVDGVQFSSDHLYFTGPGGSSLTYTTSGTNRTILAAGGESAVRAGNVRDTFSASLSADKLAIFDRDEFIDAGVVSLPPEASPVPFFMDESLISGPAHYLLLDCTLTVSQHLMVESLLSVLENARVP